MKIKPRTKQAFHKWCETHKMSDTFTWEGKPIKGSEFKKILSGGKTPVVEPKAEKIVEEPVNTDIQEEQHADMGQPFDLGDSEEY